MAAASVDLFSGGRFLLGLGTSHKVQVEPEHGLVFEKPVARLREYVGVIRELIRKGVVSHQGDVFTIENFDFWFEPLKREIPIYVAAVFPKMLEVCGEIAQGALMTWCTLEHAETAAWHVAEGAKRAGRSPEDVEVATLLPCAAGSPGEAAMEGLRTNIARYAALFPRYRRLMEQAGFTEELQAVRRLWNEGNQEEARRLIPTELIDKIALVGDADHCRHKLDEYRRAGITQPIISPRVSGPNPKEEAMQIIRACAPR